MRAWSVLLLLLSVSCSSSDNDHGPTEGERARDYNDRIVSMQDSLIRYFGQVSEAISRNDAADSRAAIDLFRKTISRFSDSLRAVLDFEGDSSLKAAALDLFAAYLDEAQANYAMLPVVLKEDAIDTLRFPDSIAAEDSIDLQPSMEQAWNRIDRKAEASRKAESEFSRAQREFAARHGFRLAVD
jgi:hypothetical protein